MKYPPHILPSLHLPHPGATGFLLPLAIWSKKGAKLGEFSSSSACPSQPTQAALQSIPVSLWSAFLHVLPFGPPLTPNTEHPTRAGDSDRFQALSRLLKGELYGLTLLQAPEALHVQLTLGEGSMVDFNVSLHYYTKTKKTCMHMFL